jgi:hypothetical protein
VKMGSTVVEYEETYRQIPSKPKAKRRQLLAAIIALLAEAYFACLYVVRPL